MISKILVPIDGSEHARHAIDFASEIAVKLDAKIMLLHAVPVISNMSEGQRRYAEVEHIEGSPDVVQTTIAEQQLMTNARKRAIDAGARQVDILVETGDPAEVILFEAKKYDLVVMGRRGLGPVKALLQGSVSQKVNQLSEAACVTVK